MNDLPAVVAWLVAAVVAALVAVVWLAVRHLPRPAAPRWRRRVLGWTAAAATLGPPIVVLTLLLLGSRDRWSEWAADPRQALLGTLGTMLFMTGWFLFVAVAFFALPYVPLLLLWARLGPTLGRLESTRRGVAVSAALLALPGALASVVAYGVLDEPFGYQGAELARFGAVVLGAITVSLLVPRLLFPSLRPGAFAGARGDVVGPHAP